jgi:HAMP domain-containing protein
MTQQQWVTVVLALVGIVANAAWILVGRYLKALDEVRNALTGENGAVARLHSRIDKLGDTYQTRKETEMQFEHLREFMERDRAERERRHHENLQRFEDLKDSQKASEESVRHDVRELRKHLDDVRNSHAA